MHGRMKYAPLVNSHRILNVGYGTGVVSRVLEQTIPSTEVYGVDISRVPAANAERKNVPSIQKVMPQLLYFDNTGVLAEG